MHLTIDIKIDIYSFHALFPIDHALKKVRHTYINGFKIQGE